MTLVRPYREEHDDLSATSPDLSGELAETDLSGSPFPLQGTERAESSQDRTGEVDQEQLPADDEIPF